MVGACGVCEEEDARRSNASSGHGRLYRTGRCDSHALPRGGDGWRVGSQRSTWNVESVHMMDMLFFRDLVLCVL